MSIIVYIDSLREKKYYKSIIYKGVQEFRSSGFYRKWDNWIAPTGQCHLRLREHARASPYSPKIRCVL